MKFSARAAAVAIAIIALLIVLTAVPEQRALAIQIYAFGICGLVLLGLLGRPAPGGRRIRVRQGTHRRGTRPVPLPELARVEREVTLGRATAFDLHFRLRPRIREIAASRLADRRGIDLERRPDAAREVLDEAVWELVRPDREPRRATGTGRGWAARAPRDAGGP